MSAFSVQEVDAADELFQHCANLIASELSSLVTSSDHKGLYASYKLSLDSAVYSSVNRDTNRPALWNVKDRAKFNAVCEYLDANSAVEGENGWKEKYVEIVRGIHERKFTGKFMFDTDGGGEGGRDLLDEYPLYRKGGKGGETTGGGGDVLENKVSQPVFAREVNDTDSDVGEGERSELRNEQRLRGAKRRGRGARA